MNEPKISIVIPAYNAASFLDNTIQSVIDQTESNWELVVIDDGSSDSTYALAQEWSCRDSRIRAYTKENGGVATARNFGLEKINPNTEFVILLDHDDLWEPHALSILRNALEADKDAVAAHGLARKSSRPGHNEEILGNDRRRLVLNGNRVRPIRCNNIEPTTFAVMAYDGCLCTPGMVLIRRSAMYNMPLFRQDLAPSDDFDFWMRLTLRGHFAYVNEVVIEWRQHETNVSGNNQLMEEALARNRCHVVRLEGLNDSQRVLAFWRYKRMSASIIRHNAVDYRKWALKSLSQRQMLAAFLFFGLSLSEFTQYLRLRFFWNDNKDRGPLPARIKGVKA